MPVSVAMKAHLAQGTTFICPALKMTALDGAVAAYCGHTRQLTIDSVLYQVGAIDPSRAQRRTGLEPNTSDVVIPFDDTVIEAEVYAGKWKHARIEKFWVNYLDLTMGKVYLEKGFAGKFGVVAGRHCVPEFRSLSQQFHQEIGDVVQPNDLRASISELGIDPAPHTHARTVTGVTSRQVFTVGGSAQADNYFRYGSSAFTAGNNDGIGVEIKSNAGNVITLQLAMPYDIQIGDTVTLIRGYDGTRASAKALGAIDTFMGFPDLSGLNAVLRFPG